MQIEEQVSAARPNRTRYPRNRNQNAKLLVQFGVSPASLDERERMRGGGEEVLLLFRPLLADLPHLHIIVRGAEEWNKILGGQPAVADVLKKIR